MYIGNHLQNVYFHIIFEFISSKLAHAINHRKNLSIMKMYSNFGNIPCFFLQSFFVVIFTALKKSKNEGRKISENHA